MVLSFLQPYRKTARNLDAAASLHGFDWRDPPLDEKRELLADLAAIAADAGMTPTLCTQPHLLDVPGVSAARCIDMKRLSDIAGRPVAGRRKGNRPGCDCAESRDIGDYDTCTQGCAYCYAVNSRASAQRRLKAHDPEGELLRPGGLKRCYAGFWTMTPYQPIPDRFRNQESRAKPIASPAAVIRLPLASPLAGSSMVSDMMPLPSDAAITLPRASTSRQRVRAASSPARADAGDDGFRLRFPVEEDPEDADRPCRSPRRPRGSRWRMSRPAHGPGRGWWRCRRRR